MFDNEDNESFEEREEKLFSELDRFDKMIRARESFFFDVETLEDMIDFHINNLDFEKANQVLTFGEKIHPHNTELKLRRAEYLNLINREEDALNLLDELEKAEPGESEIYLIRGNALVRLQRPSEAIRNYQIALTNLEFRQEGYLGMAQAYRSMNDYENVEKYLLKYLDEFSQLFLIYDSLYELYTSTGRVDKGIEVTNRLIEKDPYCYEAWLLLGSFHSHSGNFEKALEAYEYCIAIDDSKTDVYAHLGMLYMENEKYEKAIENFRKSLGTPVAEDYFIITSIGDCYQELGNAEAARFYYRKALKIFPEFPEPYMDVAFTYTMQGRWQEAIVYVKKALDRKDDLGSIWALYGDCMYHLNNLTEAENYLLKALELEPENLNAWKSLLRLMMETGAYKTGIEKCSEAIKYFPEDPEIRCRLIAFLYFDRQIKESYNELEQFLNTHPGSGALLFELCSSLRSDKHILSLVARK